MSAATMMAVVEGPPADVNEDPAGSRASNPTASHDFDVLFRDSGAGVYRTLYAFSGGRRDIAEDATAEAFARAVAHARTIRDPLAWIYRTAFRLAALELKTDARRGHMSEDETRIDADRHRRTHRRAPWAEPQPTRGRGPAIRGRPSGR